MKLFHVSEEAGIARFEPRVHPQTGESIVWAVSDERLHNYLVPRDCPRVTFFASPKTSLDDAETFLGSSHSVVAIEAEWWTRLKACQLHCYELPQQPFECRDETAGYYVSPQPVFPIGTHLVEDPIAELLRRRVELRIVPNLWHLHNAVANSSLAFSMIRMRNAKARS